jgi:solute carrier family 25 folate transporter 32
MQKQQVDPRVHAVAGAVQISSVSIKEAWSTMLTFQVAGLSSTVVFYPLDLVKVRFQVAKNVTGIWSKMKEIVRAEGVRGLFGGLSASVVASALSWGGFFYFYENAKKRRGAGTVLRDALNSVEAGGIMVMFTNPIWLVKTRLQLQEKSHAYRYI